MCLSKRFLGAFSAESRYFGYDRLKRGQTGMSYKTCLETTHVGPDSRTSFESAEESLRMLTRRDDSSEDVMLSIVHS